MALVHLELVVLLQLLEGAGQQGRCCQPTLQQPRQGDDPGLYKLGLSGTPRRTLSWGTTISWVQAPTLTLVFLVRPEDRLSVNQSFCCCQSGLSISLSLSLSLTLPPSLSFSPLYPSPGRASSHIVNCPKLSTGCGTASVSTVPTLHQTLRPCLPLDVRIVQSHSDQLRADSIRKWPPPLSGVRQVSLITGVPCN